MKLIERIKGVAVVVGLFVVFGGFVWGTYTYLDTQYAKAADMKRIEQRLDGKILEDRIANISEQLWTLENRYYKKEMPEEARDKYRRLQEEKKKLEGYMKEYTK